MNERQHSACKRVTVQEMSEERVTVTERVKVEKQNDTGMAFVLCQYRGLRLFSPAIPGQGLFLNAAP